MAEATKVDNAAKMEGIMNNGEDPLNYIPTTDLCQKNIGLKIPETLY